MQDSTPLLYSRGFLLSDTEEPLLEGLQHYAKRQVGAKVLYHDQITPVETHTCQDGWLTTIGTVLEAKSNRDSNPPGSIAARLWTSFHNGGLDALEGELYDLGGRYAVFASNGQDTWVYHDASGTRAVYYDVGSGNVGSHFDMLERLCVYRPVGSSPIEKLRLDLRNRRTAHPEILSLLPNHRLNIQRASQERFFLHRPNSARTVDFESKIQTVIGSWESQLSRAVEQADHIGFSMTGGWDSRLLLALASKFSDSFTSFTYTYAGATRGEPPKNQWDESMKLDHDIVNRLKPFLPTSHTFIPKTEESQDVWRQAHLSTLKRNSEGAHGRRPGAQPRTPVAARRRRRTGAAGRRLGRRFRRRDGDRPGADDHAAPGRGRADDDPDAARAPARPGAGAPRARASRAGQPRICRTGTHRRGGRTRRAGVRFTSSSSTPRPRGTRCACWRCRGSLPGGRTPCCATAIGRSGSQPRCAD